MKASVKLFKSDGKTSRGYPVKLIVHHGKTKRKTIGYSSLNDWDDVKGLPRFSHPDYENLFGLVLDLKKRAITMDFLNLEDPERGINFLLEIKSEHLVLVSEYFEKQIALLENQKRYGTADNYDQVKQQLEYFAPGLKLKEVDSDLIYRFKHYKKQHVKDTTIASYLSKFRALYNKALLDPDVSLEDRRPFKNCMKGLSVRVRRQKQRFLTKEMFQKVMNRMDELTLAETRAIQLGMLQFYLGGSNLKDIYYLKSNQFFGDRVIMVRSKLQNPDEFDLKVFDCAREILNRYGNFSREFVFPWPKDEKRYKTFRSNHNRALRNAQKRIGIKMAPTNQNLNSNAFRHTFKTYGKHYFIEADIIRELMGHERNDPDTAYAAKYPESVRDAAHWKIINLTDS